MGRIRDPQAEERNRVSSCHSWHGGVSHRDACAHTLCIASMISSSRSSLIPHYNNSLCSSLFCSAPVCFSPAACHAAFPTPTAFQHFPQSLAVEMQLGLLLPSHLLPLPEGWRSLFCCSHVLIFPDKPAEKPLRCGVSFCALTLLLLSSRTEWGND